jgi:CRISP-associated protein Cas1
MRAKISKISLDNYGSYLGRKEGCLVVYDKKKKEERFPLFANEIGEIQLRSGNTVSTGVLATCGYWNIDVLILTNRGQPVSILKSLSSDDNVKTRLCQYESSKDHRALKIAKTILQTKLQGQNNLLKKYGLRTIDYNIFEKINEIENEDLKTARNKLHNIEGHGANQYFSQIFQFFDISVRPQKRVGFKAYDGINNLFNLAYKMLNWKIHIALINAHLEPFLGYLHETAYNKPSLICDFQEIYRYLIDDFLIEYAQELKAKSFKLQTEFYSSNRKGKRQYLTDDLQKQFSKNITLFFQKKVNIQRICNGKSQEIETLISEEALLFAKYLRGERTTWTPRLVEF